MSGLILSQPEIENLFGDIGMGKRPRRVGAAIALCEAPAKRLADGTPCADFGLIGDIELETEKYGPSVGGLQIRSLKADKGTGSWRDEDALIRPRFNCRAAEAIYHDQGWDPWTTFKNLQYRAYLQDLFPVPPGIYVVLAGDSLTTIAANPKVNLTGWTWQDLARKNNIHDPYPIGINQWLEIP